MKSVSERALEMCAGHFIKKLDCEICPLYNSECPTDFDGSITCTKNIIAHFKNLAREERKNATAKK